WFTDPPFGILGNYEGHVATPELPTNIYRLDKSGRVTVAIGDVNRPNGLCFTPDERKMYVVEAGLTPRVIKVLRGGRRHKTRKRPRLRHLRGAGDARRLPLRRRWQPVVRLGHGRGPRWRSRVQPRRQAHRQDQSSGARRQPLLRRLAAQSPVHGGEPLAL